MLLKNTEACLSQCASGATDLGPEDSELNPAMVAGSSWACSPTCKMEIVVATLASQVGVGSR